ncbi:hypothetical protein B4064_1957 [Caldibacillus thermoamylovorans]|uniref:Uncharacterized protein n=1 Tax=Caldibacillus thermoamylovorans TaxID=35841 RepID=A0A0D0EP98_9BACI|nr:hypothetical protein B4064_1957 [Caldibacillus thermoamylovorans]KIO68524.1 hypothetical protein B4065_1603 [Caldibacillus thermoamylovorans]KIO69128.1 hypothetical protein B4166_1991 [Caldibacillus thermoamylovorans]KIO73204.1 hypothetical protein B4167_2345 [Caldibacillus thermoamylovorans]
MDSNDKNDKNNPLIFIPIPFASLKAQNGMKLIPFERYFY